MKRAVLITSNHQRHKWLAAQLHAAAPLAGVIVESKAAAAGASPDPVLVRHFAARDASEAHWFADAPAQMQDLGCPVLQAEWGSSGGPAARTFITQQAPELILLFGSSIIKEPLLSDYSGCIVNMHLGLSPYYRGSGTNFWPLADGLPECVGVTVHHAVLKVDAGRIIGQARPRAAARDSMHDLGCKTIAAGALLLETLLRLPEIPPGVPQTGSGKLCRRNDFDVEALQLAQRNFEEGMMLRYLDDKERRDAAYPIIETISLNT